MYWKGKRGKMERDLESSSDLGNMEENSLSQH